MTLSTDVMNDLLTLYLAGDASADTRAIVETYAREHPEFAARLQATRALSLPEAGPAGAPAPPPDAQLQALAKTKQFILLRTIFLADAVLFTLTPFVFAFNRDGITFLILGRHPEVAWAFWSVAAASWVAWYLMHRRVRLAGL